MHDNLQDLLDLSTLLGITDNSQDGLLRFLLGYARNLVLNYCNITEIPDGLRPVLVMIAAGEYGLYGNGGDDEMSSLKEGDTTVNFVTALDRLKAMDQSTFLLNYQDQLNAFRRMRW